MKEFVSTCLYTISFGTDGDQFVGLLVKCQVPVAEMRASHVLVKILRLHEQGKNIREELVGHGRNVAGGGGAETGRPSDNARSGEDVAIRLEASAMHLFDEAGLPIR
ncbi:hypothetical protein [Martelella sp. AMO21009]